ncbi:hypothetical protein FPOAC2_11019 [Fusarium poae]|uniref:hypothetical protein n=1 Tax=Fusarium poae TaxID=36050 RepID=UPI001CE87B08|nr:hypothetical protein FPOAC1_010734 [Fusarium poae]KAG8665933.1 hypothetical protein FPOAC1_010734 [Fusarium poae]
MDFLPLHLQVQLGFLIAVSRWPGNPEEHADTKANADLYSHMKREYLVRAQWAIEKLEAGLDGQAPIRGSLGDPQRDTRSRDLTSA